MTDTEDLDDLANRMRAIYTREYWIFEKRQARKVGTDLPACSTWDGDIAGNIWRELAQFLLDECLETVPNDFIQCVFDAWGLPEAPTPSQLIETQSLEMYDYKSKERLCRAERGLLSQIEHLGEN